MKFNHTAHKALWNWLAENPFSSPMDWPEWEENGGRRPKECCFDFACGLAFRVNGGEEGRCSECPLVWPGNDGDCIGEGGLFSKFEDGDFEMSREEAALQIANLPVKPGVECE